MLEITVGRHAHLSLEGTGKFPSFRSMAVAHSCRGRSCGLVRPNTRKCTPLARSKTRTFSIASAALAFASTQANLMRALPPGTLRSYSCARRTSDRTRLNK